MNWTDYLQDPMLAAFVPVERGRTRMLVRSGYEAVAERLGLEGVPDGVARVEGGRQPHPLVEVGGGERAVLRRYRRGGLMRHVNRDRYLLGHRAWEELRVTEHAAAAGVRVPVVLAATETRHAIGYTAALATRWIAGAVDLGRWLPDASRRARIRVLREVGRQTARLHDAGIHHPDLNLRNFVLTPGAEEASTGVHVLDFDRARTHGEPLVVQRRAAALNRLGRSARKLGQPLDAEQWAALQAGYGAGWPFAPPRRR